MQGCPASTQERASHPEEWCLQVSWTQGSGSGQAQRRCPGNADRDGRCWHLGALGHPRSTSRDGGGSSMGIWSESYRTDPSATWPWGPGQAGLWVIETLAPPPAPPPLQGDMAGRGQWGGCCVSPRTSVNIVPLSEN